MLRFGHSPPPWDATTSDEELVARAQKGEREAFGALYDRYLPVWTTAVEGLRIS